MSEHLLLAVVPAHHDPDRHRFARLDRLRPLIDCLESLIAAADHWTAGGSTVVTEVRILLVDDGSPVPLEKLLPSSVLDSVEVLRLDERHGQGAALNLALAKHDAAVYAFTDSDCVVTNTWLTTIAELAERTDDIDGIAGPPWRHGEATGLKATWLTEHETRLIRYCTERATRNNEVRLDCRNVWLRGDVVEKMGPETFFPENAGAALSGMTSRILATSGVVLGFEERLHVQHLPVTSIRTQALTYFSRGATSDLADHYAGEGSLRRAFVRTYARRHFLEPVRAGVHPAYVLLAHGAYWCGLSWRRLRRRRGRAGSA